MNPVIKDIAIRILTGRLRSAYWAHAIAKAHRLTVLNFRRVSRGWLTHSELLHAIVMLSGAKSDAGAGYVFPEMAS